jgi:hypothetical protein
MRYVTKLCRFTLYFESGNRSHINVIILRGWIDCIRWGSPPPTGLHEGDIWRGFIQVRFEVLMAVAMTPCNLVVHQRFGGKLCLHLQGLSVSHASNQQEARRKRGLCLFLVG